MNGFTIRAFLFLVALSAPLGAFADSQAGGLPTLADRVTVLETSVSTLQNAVTSLQATVANLQSANANLQTALNAEIAARIAGDNALQSALASLQTALNAEITARIAGDVALQSALATETANRQSGDASLNSSIQDLRVKGLGAKVFSTSVDQAEVPNGDLTTVATLGSPAAPLPPGRYLVTSKANVFNFNHNADWDCFLGVDPTGGGTFFNFDVISASTESNGLNATNDNAVVALEGIVTVPDSGPGGQVRLQCLSREPGSTVFAIQVVALQVI